MFSSTNFRLTMREVEFKVDGSNEIKTGYFHLFSHKDVIYPPQTPVRRINCAIVEDLGGNVYEVMLQNLRFL